MGIRLYKSYTPGTRNRALSSFAEITKTKPEKSLIQKNHKSTILLKMKNYISSDK